MNVFLCSKIQECLKLVSKSTVNLTWVCQVSKELKFNQNWIKERFSSKEISQMSNMGRRVFFEDKTFLSKKSMQKQFVILIWDHWQHLQNRFIYNYGQEVHDPFDGNCLASNCIFTGCE